MSTCDNCYQGCAETISDQCIKYTGIDIPQLGIVRGDSLATVEQKIFNHLRTGEGIVIDLSGISICSIMQDYLPASQDYPPGSENAPTEFVLNDVLAALIQYSCLLQGQIGLQGQRIADNNLTSQALINEERFARVNEFEAVAGIITEISATFTTDIQTATALITSESIARATADEATASVIENVSANITALDLDVNARITQERTASVTREQAIATMVDTVATSLETETGLREAAVTQLTESISTESEARATLETNLNAKVTQETNNRVAAIGQATINILQQADATATTARALLKTDLEAKVTQEGTDRTAAISQAKVLTLQEANATATAARAILKNDLEAKISQETTDRTAAISQANITTLQQVDVKVGNAKAEIITELEAKVETDIGTLSSDITTELDTWATVLGTGASNFTTLKSTVNDYSANIDTAMTTAASANGKVDAQYSLSVNAGGKVAGMKLGSNGTTSDIVFTADSFKVSNGSSGTSGVITPFEVVNNQVVLKGITTADTLITPGNGPAHPTTGWNGLSVNKNNDNAIRFRHANGQIGIEMGIINGELVLNWYNDQGVLVWKGGSSGIVYLNNVPASWSARSMGLISDTIGEFPTSAELADLTLEAENELAISSGTGFQQVATADSGSTAVFPVTIVQNYYYLPGVNPQSSANQIYEGYHTDNGTFGFITNGWWAFRVSGGIDSFMSETDGTRVLIVSYIKNGLVTRNLYLPSQRLSTGSN